MGMAGEEIGVQEPEAALERFRSLMDRAERDARQDHPPTAIHTPWVVVWLMVYQRLHANAPLSGVLTKLFRIKEYLPPSRRITEETLSTNTGAYSQARSRLDPEVVEVVSDHVYRTLTEGATPGWEGRRVFQHPFRARPPN
jgi:hypothetical protein